MEGSIVHDERKDNTAVEPRVTVHNEAPPPQTCCQKFGEGLKSFFCAVWTCCKPVAAAAVTIAIEIGDGMIKATINGNKNLSEAEKALLDTALDHAAKNIETGATHIIVGQDSTDSGHHQVKVIGAGGGVGDSDAITHADHTKSKTINICYRECPR